MPLPITTQLKIKAKDIFRRVTLNKITTFFFIFTFIQCFSQAIIHSFLFTVDLSYYNVLNDIAKASNFSAAQGQGNYTWPPSLDSASLSLAMCNDVNVFEPLRHCEIVFDVKEDVRPVTDITQDSILRGITARSIFSGKGGGQMFTVMDASSNYYTDNNITTVGRTYDSTLHPVLLRSPDQNEIVLNQQCVQILSYPQQHMQNAEREDLSLVFLQFWLLALAFLGLIWNSVPHLLAVLCARTFPAAWSTYSIWRTLHQKSVFAQLIEQPGSPCSVELFTEYFQQRFIYQIIDAILGVTSLICSAFFIWSLIKVYNNHSFKTVGAPDHVMRLYKYFHGLQATLLLEVFVLLNAMSLWADQFFNGYIHHASEHTAVYEAGWLFSILILLPWLSMGWIAIRREIKGLMIAFLAISFTLLVGWLVMFDSQVYRWTFIMWPNVSCYTVASLLLLTISLILGGICWRHFGEGLASYLHAEAALESSHFAADRFEHDVEKNAISYDPDAIEYDLRRKTSKLSKLSRSSQLSIGSFAAGVMSPIEPAQPQPTFYTPDFPSRRRTDSVGSSFVGLEQPHYYSPNPSFAPLRRNS